MSQGKVLFIDDEPIILEFAKEQFEAANFEIKTFNNSALAVETLKDNKFDIIISDFNMPNFTGFELASKVRSELKLDTPIVLLTGNHQLSVVEADRLKILKIFRKPIDLDEVVVFVEQCLNKK